MRAARIPGLIVIICCLAGCGVLPRGRSPSRPQVTKVKEGESALKRDLTIEELQSHLMGFADDFALAMMHSVTTLEGLAENNEERSKLRQWKLSHINAAIVLASGPNPAINLLDLTGMTTLGRQAFEDDWMPLFGERGKEVLEVHKRYEQTIWRMVERVLKPEPVEQLREIINEWQESHPEKRFGAFVGLCDYAKARYQSPERVRTRTGGSLFSVFYMDPMAGVEPAMRQLEQTRYFAERTMYYAQRLPAIVRLQVELIISEFGAAPETQKVLNNITEFRETAQRFTDVLEQLPERIGTEQQKVIEGLAGQEKLKERLGDFNATFGAGKAMADSVERAVRNIETLVAQLSKTNQAATPSRPFDVMEYATTAEKIDRAAVQLATTLESLDRVVRSPGWTERMTEVTSVMGHTEKTSQRLLDRAFWLALALIAAALAAALTYKYTSRRVARQKTEAFEEKSF